MPIDTNNSVESFVAPNQLEVMAKKVANSDLANDPQQKEELDYIAGWVSGAAENEYRKLLKRDGLPRDPRVIKLLCELAVMRALIRWHEIRDRPPPMPSIDSI